MRRTKDQSSIRASRRRAGSVTKKGPHWYAVLSVGRDAEGRQLRYWSKGFKTKFDAERGLAQLLIDGKRARAKSSATVRDLVDAYIAHDMTSRGKRSPTTTQRYKGLRNNMGPILDDAVDKLTGTKIELFYEYLLERDELSHTTVHHVHNLLFASCRWGVSKRIGLITCNPFDLDAVEKPRRAKGNAHSFTVDQARRALDYLAQTKHVNALTFSLASACRRGETCGLKWSAVDLDRKVAIIRESRYQVRGEQGQKVTKADRIREVPLNRTALDALVAERKRQDDRRTFAGDAWTETGFVFTDELGLPLSPMALTNAFGRCARRAGLPTTRMHDLRHTAATFILSGSGNPVAATEILGHSDKSTTLRIYGHVIGRDAIKAAKAIDRALVSRKISRRATPTTKKARKSGPKLVAPTGIEPVFAT